MRSDCDSSGAHAGLTHPHGHQPGLAAFQRYRESLESRSMIKPLRGLLAALLTHRKAGGEGYVDFGALERNADFALSNGADGIVPCGGTGEYFALSARQREEIFEVLAPVVHGRGHLIAGIGSARLEESVRLARHAFANGANAVLLPPPHFFRYGQAELAQFYREAAAAIGGPMLIYNLAGFVSPVSPATAVNLLQTEEHIVGLKDSSGDLSMLRLIEKKRIPCVGFQGHDMRLAESIRENLADGAISGPASVVPEALAPLLESPIDSPPFMAAATRLDEFLDRLQRLPYPWVLKWAASLRGFGNASLPFPLGHEHIEAKRQFESWFERWLASPQ